MQNISNQQFIAGELYVFRTTDSDCPAEGGLYGIFDCETPLGICLESSTLDFRHFSTWHRLPAEYRFCRLASRDELRDYTYNLACHECMQAYVEPQALRAEVSAAYWGRGGKRCLQGECRNGCLAAAGSGVRFTDQML